MMNEEFPFVSKADWLRQVAKDLKDKSLDDLQWQLPDGLSVSPFVHTDDFEQLRAPLMAASNWEICEDIQVGEAGAANRQALDALEGGAECLCFWLDQPLDAAAFSQMLTGIHLDFIGLHFAGPGVAANPGAVLGNLQQLAQQRSIPTASLHGSLAYNPLPVSKIVDWRYLAELIQFAAEDFPGFKIVSIGVTDDLSLALRHANTYLQKFSAQGISTASIAAAMQFSLSIGKSYLLEIARLRALQLLWVNVLKAWGLPLTKPMIEAHFAPAAYSDEIYTNMVRATTMAMSAVLGGADRLTVLPYDAGREAQANYPPDFGRRIARNVQHLLKMESGLDKIADPAAGSFYLENLTQQLAAQAWAAFQK